jgi:hypothetical protein
MERSNTVQAKKMPQALAKPGARDAAAHNRGVLTSGVTLLCHEITG